MYFDYQISTVSERHHPLSAVSLQSKTGVAPENDLKITWHSCILPLDVMAHLFKAYDNGFNHPWKWSFFTKSKKWKFWRRSDKIISRNVFALKKFVLPNNGSDLSKHSRYLHSDWKNTKDSDGTSHVEATMLTSHYLHLNSPATTLLREQSCEAFIILAGKYHPHQIPGSKALFLFHWF